MFACAPRQGRGKAEARQRQGRGKAEARQVQGRGKAEARQRQGRGKAGPRQRQGRGAHVAWHDVCMWGLDPIWEVRPISWHDVCMWGLDPIWEVRPISWHDVCMWGLDPIRNPAHCASKWAHSVHQVVLKGSCGFIHSCSFSSTNEPFVESAREHSESEVKGALKRQALLDEKVCCFLCHFHRCSTPVVDVECVRPPRAHAG